MPATASQSRISRSLSLDPRLMAGLKPTPAGILPKSPTWFTMRSSSESKVRMISALRGTLTPATFSTAWQKLQVLDTLQAPQMRSTICSASSGVFPSTAFSMPRWVKNSLASSCSMASPAWLKRKCPGSIIPAWIGPTGTSKSPCPLAERTLNWRSPRTLALTFTDFRRG